MNEKVHEDGTNISNDASFRLNHLGVPDGSDGSDGTLYPLMENYTLPVALHSICKVYFGHWSERMWSVNLDASISGVSDPRRAFLPPFRVTGSADDKPGSTWERRRHVWEHLESQSCILFVFSSMNVCIYVSISLPIYRCYIWTGCRRCLRAIRRAPENDNRVNSEIYPEAVMERVWRYTWGLRFGELRDALGGRDRASVEMHLETEIEWTQWCTWRL